MTKSRLFQVVLLMAIAAFFVCRQQALAQVNPHHFQVKAIPRAPHSQFSAATAGETPPAAALYGKVALFGVMPAQDANGYDEWPCMNDSWWPNQADCAQIAPLGIVIGHPQYTVPYNGNPTDTPPILPCYYTTEPASGTTWPNCGQIINDWEDETGDSTDELYQQITVKQGTTYILDTGTMDFGTNPGSQNVSYVSWLDTLFGTLGQPTVNSKGKAIKNDGECWAASGTTGEGSNTASGKTCYNPVPGLADVTITTWIGTAASEGKVVIDTCSTATAVNQPCKITQKFTIYFYDIPTS